MAHRMPQLECIPLIKLVIAVVVVLMVLMLIVRVRVLGLRLW